MSLDKKIYKKLLEVPKGKITTYGELAKAVGLKNGQRAVGKIMNKNPYPVIIPCHRVIKSDGSRLRNRCERRTARNPVPRAP
jgi:methylated-DNA-[protein]-cysteine S-methyltransferase